MVDGADVIAYRPDGKAFRFTPSGANWVTDADTPDRLIELIEAGTRVGWEFHAASGDELETYDAAGKPVTIRARNWASPGISDTFDRCDDDIGGVRWQKERMDGVQA